jgi:hypothetical protein
MKDLLISEVTTAQKVGVIIPTDSPQKKWSVKWEMNIDDVLKDKSGRVYMIVVNGKIYKIGGSMDKKGILGTMGWYEKNAFSGRPSIRTHGIHMLIDKELQSNNTIEIYMILSDKVVADVKGLFGTTTKMASIDFKEMENQCKNDYFKKCGTYPMWNYQENGNEWDLDLVESCNLVSNQSASKRKKK